MTDRTDEQLMDAYCRGDNAAFQVLHQRYAGRLLSSMRRYLGSEDDAQELVQQTFLQLHRSRRDFRPGSKLRPWLYTIANNLRREAIRRRIRRPEQELTDAHAPSVDPHDLEEAERARALRAALLRLPESLREVVELHWFSGLPFAEVAEIVGANTGAVKVRAHRAYEKLRTFLRQNGNQAPRIDVQTGENA